MLVVNDQVLDLTLQPIVVGPQAHVLLGLPGYLLVASFNLFQRLLESPWEDEVMLSGFTELNAQISLS